MSQFHGVCSYPHGGYAGAGLLVASCAAFSATAYACASCRLAVLTFVSDRGGFEGHFAADNGAVTNGQRFAYRASVGLFQWLRPVDDDALRWNEGSCVGYQESMLTAIRDDAFDASRSVAVIAVLSGLIVSLWAVVSACVAWNRLQLSILRVLLLVGTVTAGASLTFLRSSVCGEAFEPEDAGCELDDGGLVLIAAVILWCAAFVVSVVFLRAYSPADPEDTSQQQHGVEKARRAGTVAASHHRQQQQAALRRERDRMRRQMQLKKMAQSAAVSSPVTDRTAPRTPDTGDTQTKRNDNDRSRDSADSVDPHRRHRPRASGPQRRERETTGHTTHSRTPSSSAAGALTVDDVSSRNELEVYINQKMARIKHLMDMDKYGDDDDDDDDDHKTAEV